MGRLRSRRALGSSDNVDATHLLRWPTGSTVAAEIKRPEAAVALIRAFGAALLGFAMAINTVGAPGYPTQTIKLIVPFTAGGPVDALARVVAQHLQNRVGQNVIVENRSGGGTTIGAKAVAAAPPDGCTLLVVGPNIAYYPVLFPNLDFDPDQGADACRNPGHVVASDRRGPVGAG